VLAFPKLFSFFFRHYYGERTCLFQIGQQNKQQIFFKTYCLFADVIDSRCSVFHFKDSGDQYRFNLAFHVLVHLVMRLPRIVINPPQAEFIHVTVIVPENAIYGVGFPGVGFLDNGQRE
jgi:hypothetical protein